MFEVVKSGSRYPFIQHANKFLFASGMAVLASVLLLTFNGLNLGIDFKGGNKLIVAFDEDAGADQNTIREVVATLVEDKLGGSAGQIEVQGFDVGGGGEGERKLVKFQVYTELTSLLGEKKASEIKERITARLESAIKVLDKDGKPQPAKVASIDRPAETDKFIVVLQKEADVLPTKAAILEAVQGSKECGQPAGEKAGVEKPTAKKGECEFKHAEVVSEEERAIDMEFYKEYNLTVAERAKAGEAIADDDFERASAAHQKEKEEKLAKRQDKTYTVSLQQIQEEMTDALVARFGTDAEGRPKAMVESSTSVSPSVGADLFNKGILAMVYAFIGMLIYIGLRFDFRYSPGAVVALIHDTIITLGVFSLFEIKFTLPIVSALLTIIGYSLNDTIVVYDRIRENLTKFKGMDLRKLINQSINETLSRTLLTSGTTIVVVLALLFLGGGLIKDFALALTVGIMVGTYSSIFVASPLVILLDDYLEKRKAAAKGSQQAPAKA